MAKLERDYNQRRYFIAMHLPIEDNDNCTLLGRYFAAATRPHFSCLDGLANEGRNVVSLASHFGASFRNPMDITNGFPKMRRLTLRKFPMDDARTLSVPTRQSELLKIVRKGTKGGLCVGISPDYGIGETPDFISVFGVRIPYRAGGARLAWLLKGTIVFAWARGNFDQLEIFVERGPDTMDFANRQAWEHAVKSFYHAQIERYLLRTLRPMDSSICVESH